MVCPICLAIPAMIGGIGTATAGKSSGLRWLCIGSIAIVVIALLVYMYYKFWKPCSSCSGKYNKVSPLILEYQKSLMAQPVTYKVVPSKVPIEDRRVTFSDTISSLYI
jgi:hypothetical protein